MYFAELPLHFVQMLEFKYTYIVSYSNVLLHYKLGEYRDAEEKPLNP